MVIVYVLALRNAVPAAVADAGYVFSMVNEFLRQRGIDPLFSVHLVGLTRDVTLSNGQFQLHPGMILTEAGFPDLVVIPSMTGDMMTATFLNKDFAAWIAAQYKRGAAVASLCTGAFLLAHSGILKGRQCTTHWAYANEFRHHYPSVTLLDERMITDQHGIYSSGGGNAYWNLLLHLVEKYTDRAMAIRTAKYFVIELGREAQSPFIIFQGLKDHDDELVRMAQETIELQHRDKLTVDQLADVCHLSRRTFERRFKKATRHSVFEYIQRVRVEAARQKLEMGRSPVQDIMYEVGYSDIQTFREVFKDITGMTPLDYRNKYNKDNC
jgi:transcriptional regulator GlxA family with amidase domain